jgi:hypothetical protein
VAGKDYDTIWTKLKTTATVNNMAIVSEFKMWSAKDIPLSGMVKMETVTAGLTMTLELTGTGRK